VRAREARARFQCARCREWQPRGTWLVWHGRFVMVGFECARYVRSERDGLMQGKRASQPGSAAAALTAADAQAADAKPGPLSSLDASAGVGCG
jgi:hypothetical protein